MALNLIHSLSAINPLLHKPLFVPSNSPRFLSLPQKLPAVSVSAAAAAAADQQFILEALGESDDEALPAVRTYEDDLSRLTVVGAVDFNQAITAAAADGGRAAEEHISAGLEAMVVETIFPGPSEENSTLSTRLFLPAKKVKERVKSIRGLLEGDIFSSTTSENILAMTFRQVVLQQLLSFELAMFGPGTGRKMDDLENPREVPAMFSISSCDEHAIAVLAEVICSSALESVETDIYGDSSNMALAKLFNWFHKSKKFVSKDSSVIVHKLLEKEIVANVKTLLGKFNSERIESLGFKSNNSWWTLPSYSKLKKIGGPRFTAWISEYVPLYRLQIDVDKLQDLKLEGGEFSATNIWEILLTHSQMVSLASILDMYYEDDFTLPDKQLPSYAVMKLSNVSRNESSGSFLKKFSAVLAGGAFIVTLGILSQLHLPSVPQWRKYLTRDRLPPASSIRCIEPHFLEDVKLGDYCTSVIRKLKDSFGWSGDIVMEAGHYAWIGELPLYLKKMVEYDRMGTDFSPSETLPVERVEDIRQSIQDIASYQVVLSSDGKIVGFQPTSRVAVNHWASNPLAKELYGGRNLSPGLIEPGPKIHKASEVIVMELLMSATSDPHFAFVRPVNVSGVV